MYYDVVIVGGGPAALSAAIYAGRYQRQPLVIAGQAIGGQLLLTTDVDNYPGFPEGVPGAQLAMQMQQQAERFGAEFMLDVVTSVDFSDQPLRLFTGEGEVEAGSVILAPGTSRRKLGVPGEKEFSGRGVSYCATCDGFFFRGKNVAVIGGGDAAVEESIVLTRWVDRVTIIHRRDQWRADRVLQEQANLNPKIIPLWDTVVEEVLGDQTVNRLSLRHVQTGAQSSLEVEGVFIMVGSIPNTSFLTGQLDMDAHGYVSADAMGRTSVPGVIAAGEVIAGSWAQVVVAAGSGANAAYAAEQFLAEFEGRPQPPRVR
ncbi:MAG: thioredoxin-disulfide reductase [Anaerolineae bacterium]|nr:thioredoxin-disulfide reductase [Anaerolineae bacterium]